MAEPLTWRVALLALLLLGLGTSALFRRKADEQRGEVPRSRDPAPIAWLIRALMLAAFVFVGLYLVVPAWIPWALLDPPTWLRVVGLVGAAAQLPLMAWTLASLGENITPTHVTREEHELVTWGPYRYVRHPLYMIGLMFWTSNLLLTGLWPLGLILVGTGVMVAWRTPLEEAALEERFGDAYRAYRDRTGRFLPRLRRPGPDGKPDP